MDLLFYIAIATAWDELLSYLFKNGDVGRFVVLLFIIVVQHFKTATGISKLGNKIDMESQKLRTEMGVGFQNVEKEFQKVRNEMSIEFQKVRTEMGTEIQDVRTEMCLGFEKADRKLEALRSDMVLANQKLDDEMILGFEKSDRKIDALRTEMVLGFEKVDRKLESEIKDLKAELNNPH